MNPQHRGLIHLGRRPKIGYGIHLVRREARTGRVVYQVAARGAHDTRVYLGSFPSEEEARAVFAHFAATGERPIAGRKGAKRGTRQRSKRVRKVVEAPKVERPKRDFRAVYLERMVNS